MNEERGQEENEQINTKYLDGDICYKVKLSRLDMEMKSQQRFRKTSECTLWMPVGKVSMKARLTHGKGLPRSKRGMFRMHRRGQCGWNRASGTG